jgi:hypothetical protein
LTRTATRSWWIACLKVELPAREPLHQLRG